jgi:hypothetical protein
LKAVSVVFVRIIAFYEQLFDKVGWLDGGFTRFSCALSRFMRSSLTRMVHLNAVSVVFRARHHVL